ncbi:restriction endonuclease subunit S [Nostoc sp.]
MFEDLGRNTNWATYSLGDFVKINNNSYTDISDVEQYKILGVISWGNGVIVKRIVKGIELRMKRYQVVNKNQLLWCKVDTKNGAFGVTKNEYIGTLVSSNMCLADFDTDICLPNFFQLLFRLPTVYKRLTDASIGTTNRQYLKPIELLKVVRLHIPPLEEQRRILARVDELVGKIEEVRVLRQKALEETEAFVTSLHLSLADSKIVTLDEILTLDEQQEQVLFGKKYPQVGVKGFGGGLFAKEAIDATQTTYKAFNCLYEGALVLSQVKGWEGAIGVCPSYLVGKYVSPEYRTFRCIPGKAIPKYLSALVATPWFWTKLKDLTRGMGGRRERTRPEQFLKMKIPMPTVEYQQKAISIFNKIHKMKPVRVEAMKELDALLPSILDKAFKGEL